MRFRCGSEVPRDCLPCHTSTWREGKCADGIKLLISKSARNGELNSFQSPCATSLNRDQPAAPPLVSSVNATKFHPILRNLSFSLLFVIILSCTRSVQNSGGGANNRRLKGNPWSGPTLGRRRCYYVISQKCVQFSHYEGSYLKTCSMQPEL